VELRPFKKTRPVRKRTQGSALITSVVSLFIMTAATGVVLTQTTGALQLNRKQRAAATAFNLAESGAEMGALWLRGQLSPPSGTAALRPYAGAQTVGEGTYDVTVYPDTGNAQKFLKLYSIISVGTVRGERRSVKLVMQQASFGRYAYFTDRETSSIASNTRIWWKTGDRVDGPAHSNNANNSNFAINHDGSANPIFLDMLTAAGSTIDYANTRPKGEAAFKKIFQDGSRGYRLSVPYIPLPNSSDAQRNAAWGGTFGFPTVNGVYLRAAVNGGIFVRGDAALEFSLNSSADQVLTITQGTKVTSLTLNRQQQTITCTGPMGTGSASSSASLGSGVIYVTGNITSLKGVIADNLVYGDTIHTRSEFTIATDMVGGKYIKITDNLRYNTPPDKTRDPSDAVNLRAGTLGLVAKDIRISSTAPRTLEVNGVCLSGCQNLTDGSFYVENYDTKATGTLKVLGGIIQKARGPVGTLNSYGVLKTGYEKDYQYDPRLATYPPPYFPTTGQYERLSWQVLPAAN
jgi:hypothetical protein